MENMLSPAERERIELTRNALQDRLPDTGWVIDFDTGSDPQANHQVQAVISGEIAERPHALMVVRENASGEPDHPEFVYYWEPARWNEPERDWWGRGWLLDGSGAYEQDVDRAVDQFAAQLDQA